jgi:hypothetical protein
MEPVEEVVICSSLLQDLVEITLLNRVSAVVAMHCCLEFFYSVIEASDVVKVVDVSVHLIVSVNVSQTSDVNETIIDGR